MSSVSSQRIGQVMYEIMTSDHFTISNLFNEEINENNSQIAVLDFYHKRSINPKINRRDIDAREFSGWKEYDNHCRDEFHVFPVFMYEHSGQTISLNKFNDRFDSGRLGACLVSKEECPEEEKARELARARVRGYDMILQGDVYDISAGDAVEYDFKDCSCYDKSYCDCEKESRWRLEPMVSEFGFVGSFDDAKTKAFSVLEEVLEIKKEQVERSLAELKKNNTKTK